MEIAHHHFITLDSTNNCAKRNIHLFSHNKLTLITADEQTAGRGRAKRCWKSPSCQNIYASFCFFLPQEHPNLGNISQLLAISIVNALEQIGFDPQLKWPNDILLSNKKVGGILCEAVNVEDKVCMISGFGININMPLEIIKEINIPATSLMVEKGKTYPLDAVLELVKENFSQNLASFIHEGFKGYLPKLKQLMDHSLNKKIKFTNQDEVWEGIFHSLNDDGSLNLLLPSLQVKKFVSGEILYESVTN